MADKRFCVNSELPIAMLPCLHKAMLKSKGNNGLGDPKNANPESVQKAYRRVQTCKLPVFMQRGISPTKEIYINSGLPIAMVPCLHQSNVYIKRKL